jgi:hypothetical protein
MLRGNLSTRPFYNERLVSLALGGIALVALALAAFNVSQVLSLSSERSELRSSIDADQAEALRVRTAASAVQRSIDPMALRGLLIATQEANRLIDQRAFSWTVFFDYIEQTLPIDVRLVSVQPRVERGVFMVEMLVVARQPVDLETFVDNLAGTSAFPDLFVTGQRRNDDGTFGATIRTGYVEPSASADGGGRP